MCMEEEIIISSHEPEMHMSMKCSKGAVGISQCLSSVVRRQQFALNDAVHSYQT